MAAKEQKSGSAKAAKKDKPKATSGLSLYYVAGIWLALAAGTLAIAVRAMQLSPPGEQLLPGVFSQTECHSSSVRRAPSWPEYGFENAPRPRVPRCDCIDGRRGHVGCCTAPALQSVR
jgi:hypothetical protein